MISEPTGRLPVWDVAASGDNAGGQQEEEVGEQPTSSRPGLRGRLRPCGRREQQATAVVGSQRDAVGAEKGDRPGPSGMRMACRKMHGRRPYLSLCAAGVDIWIWDDGGYSSQWRFTAYCSKDGLQCLIFRRLSRRSELSRLMPEERSCQPSYPARARGGTPALPGRCLLARRRQGAWVSPGLPRRRLETACAISWPNCWSAPAGPGNEFCSRCDRRELRKRMPRMPLHESSAGRAAFAVGGAATAKEPREAHLSRHLARYWCLVADGTRS